MKELDGGKALAFENVEGHETRIVSGVCGTRERILEALGVGSEVLYRHLLDAVRNPTPCQLGDGPVKQIVDIPKLSDFPVLTHFEGDPGPYITS